MTKYKALFAIVATVAVVVAAATAQSVAAFGGVNHDYACYSSTGAPYLAATTDTSVFPTWDSFATGYFAPMAESSVPTQTPIPGGWYLTCSLPSGWSQDGSYILGDGSTILIDGPTDYLVNGMPIQGVYTVIGPAATPAS